MLIDRLSLSMKHANSSQVKRKRRQVYLGTGLLSELNSFREQRKSHRDYGRRDFMGSR